MRYFIIAKSRDGWGVALDSDLLGEFADIEHAKEHARDLREAATFRGEEYDVLDLSDAECGDPLMANAETRLN
jgi:hypothetical protein